MALAVVVAWHATTVALPPATAAAPQVAVEQSSTQTATSLRPGMTQSQAQALEQGDLTREQVVTTESTAAASPFVTNTELSSSSSSTSKPKQATMDDDYDEEDDEDEYYGSSTTTKSRQSPLRSNPNSKTTAAAAAASAASLQTVSEFANPNQVRLSSAQRAASKFYVSMAVAVPLFGGTVLREQVRRRREAAYVKRGLELQRDQYKEYFNITTTQEDLDQEIEDLKKQQQQNETNTEEEDDDEDDDDDDEDDDDDKDPRGLRRRTPRGPTKPPSPDDQDGSGGADSGDNTPNRMSDNDLDRLNQMFRKS